MAETGGLGKCSHPDSHVAAAAVSGLSAARAAAGSRGADAVPFAPSVGPSIRAVLEIFGNLSLFSLFSPAL